MAYLCAVLFLFVICQFSIQVLSQQLADSPPSEPSWPNITATCFEVLNTTVSCPGFLQRISVDNERLSADELSALCTDTCFNSLTSVRQTIVNGCNGQTDIIQYFDGVNYPSTFVIDHYIHAYDIACRKDPSTKQFCDTLMVQWLSNTDWTKDMECHDCILGTQKTLLSSPFDFTEEFAEEFASLTSSCGSTQYGYTTPGPYALGTQTSDAPLPAPTCTNSYAVKGTDTCNSISTAYNVSTYSITSRNNLYSDCSNLAAVGTICIPQQCNTYQIQSNDTCDSMIQAHGNGISGPQFLAWNPNINALCSNLGTLRQTFICFSPPGGVLSIPTPTASMPVTEPTVPVPRPTNSFPESNGDCGKWYNISTGDTCEKVSVLNSISLKDFYFLNPEINTQCSNLILDVAYCVQPIGNIQTYSGYPMTTNFITLTSNTYTTTTFTAPPKLPLPSATSTSLLPHASGTVANCFAYKNYRDIPAIVDQSQSGNLALFTNFINTCDYIRSTWAVALEDLITWNPSLNAVNCTMQPGFSYCVLQDENYKPYYTHYTSPCMSPVDPSKIPQGTISTCSCFSEVNGDDWPEFAEDCEGLVDRIDTDVSNIAKWNPWVGSDCDQGLYAGLAAGDSRAVCIGIDTSQTPTTTPLSLLTSTPGPTTTSSSSPTSTSKSTTVSSSLPTSTSGPVSTDGTCGVNSPNNATCPGSQLGSCCSNYGWCGDSAAHCGPGMCYSGACDGTTQTPSPNGECGPLHPGSFVCEGSSFGTCCSQYGYCGSGDSYCKGSNCASGACTE